MYKEGLALNNPQWLICHKTQSKQTNRANFSRDSKDCWTVTIIVYIFICTYLHTYIHPYTHLYAYVSLFTRL